MPHNHANHFEILRLRPPSPALRESVGLAQDDRCLKFRNKQFFAILFCAPTIKFQISDQKMYLPPSCSTRGVPRVVVIVPKPLLEGLLLLGFAKFGWFRTLNPSNSNMTVCSPWTLNSRETRALTV